MPDPPYPTGAGYVGEAGKVCGKTCDVVADEAGCAVAEETGKSLKKSCRKTEKQETLNRISKDPAVINEWSRFLTPYHGSSKAGIFLHE